MSRVSGVSRIVAGTYGGRRIATPAGDDTRPTADRVREALFSALDAAHVALRPPLPRPVRRLRRGRPGSRLPGRRPRAARRVRPEGGPGHPGQHRRARRRPRRRDVAAAKVAATLGRRPGRRRLRRRVRRPAVRDRRGRDRPRAGRAGRARLARTRARIVVVERSKRSPEPDLGAAASPASALADTARPRFGTVAAHEHPASRPADGPESARRLPGLVRPGHQRPPGHHRPGQPRSTTR